MQCGDTQMKKVEMLMKLLRDLKAIATSLRSERKERGELK